MDKLPYELRYHIFSAARKQSFQNFIKNFDQKYGATIVRCMSGTRGRREWQLEYRSGKRFVRVMLGDAVYLDASEWVTHLPEDDPSDWLQHSATNFVGRGYLFQ